MLPVAPSNLRSIDEPARFGIAVKRSVKSAALTSFGVRETCLRTATALYLARSVVTSPQVAVAGNGWNIATHSTRAASIARSRRCASDSLAAIEGEAQSATPNCRSGAAAAGYGSRYCLLLASAVQAAGRWSLRRNKRGAGRIRAGVIHGTTHEGRGNATRLVSDQPTEVKRYLARNVRRILTSIEEYKLTGALPLLDAIDTTLGHMHIDAEYKSFLRDTELGKKLLDTLASMANVVTVAVGIPQLSATIAQLTA